ALADEIANNQFGIGVQRGPRPGITRKIGSRLCLRHIALFGIGEGPNLIDLNMLRAEVPNVLVMIGHAGLARVSQQLEDRVLADALSALDSSNAHSLAKHMKNAGAIFR